jgi:hypothetical protein
MNLGVKVMTKAVMLNKIAASPFLDPKPKVCEAKQSRVKTTLHFQFKTGQSLIL